MLFFSPKVLFGEETVSCPFFQWTDQSGVCPLLRERTIFARRHLLRSHIKLSAKMGSAPNFISGKDKIPHYRRQGISRKVISKLKAFQWETAHCVQTHSLSPHFLKMMDTEDVDYTEQEEEGTVYVRTRPMSCKISEKKFRNAAHDFIFGTVRIIQEFRNFYAALV